VVLENLENQENLERGDGVEIWVTEGGKEKGSSAQDEICSFADFVLVEDNLDQQRILED